MRKFLPYILIFTILVGLFSPIVRVEALTQVQIDAANKAIFDKEQAKRAADPAYAAEADRKAAAKQETIDAANKAIFDKEQAKRAAVPCTAPNIPVGCTAPSDAPPAKSDTRSEFRKNIDEGCGIDPTTWFTGCLLKVLYYTLFQLPSWILWLSAQFFDVMINLGINSSVTRASGFIPAAWAVVRDFSNIFFILILLYIAIKTILGLGGSEVKKIIVHVIIMALLINFSMFFTKVVIDSSNILALVFYNKLDVNTKNSDGTSRPKDPALQTGKDISGAMWKTFDATQLITPTTIKLLKTTTVNGIEVAEETLPFSLTLGIMVIAGLIMLWAAYAFFIAGLMFIGRLIELWILIIFSPFAFMSWPVPKLAGVEYLGWEAWSKRLIATSFMAPIFMFFIYLIFMLLPEIPKFTRGDTTTILGTILGILIPAIIIMAMLLKATDFAKKGGGEFGEIIMNGVKLAAGLAIGGAALGGAGLLRGTLGAVAKSVQNDSARGKALQLKSNLKDNFKGLNKINPAAYARSIGIVGKAATAAVATRIHAISGPGGKTVGQHMQDQDRGYSQKTHATSILDQKAKSEFGHQPGYENVKYKDLTEIEQRDVKKQVDLDAMAKFKYGKQFKDLEAQQSEEVKNRYEITGERPTAGPDGKIADVKVPIGGDEKMSDVFAKQSSANAAIGEFVQALRKGSYDIRSLPDMSAKTKGFPKIGVGTIALIAAGVRLGLKKVGGVEYGAPQKDILKDIGNTVTDALKNVKINISGGGRGGGDDHTKEVKSVGH